MLPVKSVLASNAVLRPAAGEYPLLLPDNSTLINLSAGHAYELEPGVTLTVIGESTEKTAFALEYGKFRLIIPAGVDYADLKEHDPDLLQGADLLVLSPLDTSYIPPRLWIQLEPAAILWNSLELSPFDSAFTTESGNNFSLSTDGTSVWTK